MRILTAFIVLASLSACDLPQESGESATEIARNAAYDGKALPVIELPPNFAPVSTTTEALATTKAHAPSVTIRTQDDFAAMTGTPAYLSILSPALTDTIVEDLAPIPDRSLSRVESLSLSGGSISAATFAQLCKNLSKRAMVKSVQFNGCGWIDPTIGEALSHFASLESLSLEATALRPSTIASLGKVRSLTGMHFRDYDMVATDVIGEVCELPKLEVLSFGNCRNLVNEQVGRLSSLKQLKRLHIRTSKGFDAWLLDHLSGFDAIEEFDVPWEDLITRPEHARKLKSLASIKTLGRTGFSFGRIDQHEEVFLALCELASLETLVVQQVKAFSTAMCRAVAGMPKLQTLEIWGEVEVTSNGLVALADSKKITALKLCPVGVDDQVLATFLNRGAFQFLDLGPSYAVGERSMNAIAERSPGLVKLNISRCKNVTKSSLMRVLSLQQLASLDVTDVPASDREVIEEFQRMPSLKQVAFSVTTQATQDAAQVLKQQRPEIRIHASR